MAKTAKRFNEVTRDYVHKTDIMTNEQLKESALQLSDMLKNGDITTSETLEYAEQSAKWFQVVRYAKNNNLI